MTDIKTLLWLYAKQFPISPATTWSDCMNGCGNSARGGNECQACLESRMREMGVSDKHIELLRQSLKGIQEAFRIADDVKQEIREAVK